MENADHYSWGIGQGDKNRNIVLKNGEK